MPPPADAPDNCCICIEPLTNRATLLPCGHSFDAQCIRPWLQRQDAIDHGVTCPLCRYTIGKIKYNFGPDESYEEDDILDYLAEFPINGNRGELLPVPARRHSSMSYINDIFPGLELTDQQIEHIQEDFYLLDEYEPTYTSLQERWTDEPASRIVDVREPPHSSAEYALRRHRPTRFHTRDEDLDAENRRYHQENRRYEESRRYAGSDSRMYPPRSIHIPRPHYYGAESWDRRDPRYISPEARRDYYGTESRDRRHPRYISREEWDRRYSRRRL